MKFGLVNYSEISRQLNQNGYKTRNGCLYSPGIFRRLVNTIGDHHRNWMDLDLMRINVLWYGVVREFEAISYQFTLTFYTSHKRSQTTETRKHYTMC